MRLTKVLAVLGILIAPAAALAATDPAYILIDAGTGMVLTEHNSGALRFPASVTKLMTAYVAFSALKSGRLKLTSPVTVTANALAEPPSKMGFKVGTVMTFDNALKMMIVHSANDIAVAVGETVAGSEARFIAQMNATARSLGMNSSRWANPNGLPNDSHVTTARDLAVLSRALWNDFPEYRDYFRIPAIKAGRRVLRSQNTLLVRYRGSNGLKTGFTCAAGYNIVASATRSGRTLMAVVLGADSSTVRAELAARLLNQGFNGFFPGFAPADLAGFRSAAARGTAPNYHDQVCKRRKLLEEDDTADIGDSALGPPFATMAPVVVRTGLADVPAKPAAPGTVPASGSLTGPVPKGAVPLPRLRPPYRAGADKAAPSFDQRFNPGSDKLSLN